MGGGFVGLNHNACLSSSSSSLLPASRASQTLEEKVNFFIESCLGNIGDGEQQQQQQRYLKIENTTTAATVAAATTTATALASSEFCNLFHFQTKICLIPNPNPHATRRQLCAATLRGNSAAFLALNSALNFISTGRWRCCCCCRLTHKPNRSRTETHASRRAAVLPKLCHDVDVDVDVGSGVVNDAIANRRQCCCCWVCWGFTISRLS